ncbi:putative mitochondrially-localized peptidyl-trna hydrolase [Erysiphe necator]|uniref:peptidyl-tRNA hydrolase n=1 Tax=Uncinula necator TaxID=52586 RepID=A0A0B1P5N8_UNCNE|nr:putative mitochondrially-localized peptidyl-trna hydrolase [Erysiphe necator]
MMTILHSPFVTLLGTVIVAGVSGYLIGATSSSRKFFSKTASISSLIPGSRTINDNKIEISGDEDVDFDEELLNHAPDWENDDRSGTQSPSKAPRNKSVETKPSWDTQNQEECKMVLVVRTDLGMTKGKIAAQCSHAAIACYKNMLFSNPTSPSLRKWERQGQAKIALQVKSQDELLTLHAIALSLDVVAEIITDAGRTQIASGSQTVLGIGPAPRSIIDQITGTLKLL